MDGTARRLLPDLPLDDLLGELSERLSEARRSRDGLHALLDAVVSIGSDLDLETVLHRIVETARLLVDCQYAALGVIGTDGTLAEFVPVGMDEEDVAALDATSGRPHGRGILGLLIKQPQIVRLADLAEHPESYGFPPGHPAMRRFLGVPIRLRERVFGNLYLTEKSGGREFDEHDEVIIDALATAAGVAVENARLYEETKAREAWLDASTEITRSLLGGTDPEEALGMVPSRAREMGGAEAALLILPDGGLRTPENGQLAEPPAGAIAALLGGQGPVTATELGALEGAASLRPHLPGGPVLLVPLGAEGRVRGVLVLGRRPGGLPFSAATERLVATFGQQMAVVMELAEARREAEVYGLVEDRVRIARDLHDVVIQQLYAAAMSLTGAVRLIDAPEAAERVTATVDLLDETVRQIRSTIFALQPRGPGEEGLRARVMGIVQEAGHQLGLTPALTLTGLLDTDVPPELCEEAAAVLREALSNVARHARAAKVEVLVSLSGGTLTVQVVDDGVGIPGAAVRSGLDNLAGRAQRLGGDFEAGPGPEGAGTMLIWRVPVS